MERGWRWCRQNPAPSLAAATVVAAVTAVLITLSVAVVRIQASAESERIAKHTAQRQALENERIAGEERQQRRRAVRLQQEAEAQRRAAQESQNRALAATAFLVSVFESADPLGLRSFGFRQSEDRDKPLTAREILDRGRQRVEQELANQPLVQATLFDALGMAYVGLGEFDEAAPLLQRGWKCAAQRLPREHPDVLASLSSRALLKILRSEMGEAESLLREVLAAQQKSAEVAPVALARTQFYLGLVLVETFRGTEAEPLFRAALATRERELGPQDQDTLMARVMLITTLVGENKEREIGLAEGLKLVQAARPDSPVALGGLFMKYYHVNTLRNRREYDAAIAASRALREEAAEVLGSGHAIVLALEFEFAGMLRDQGKYREAEAVGRRALERVPRVIASNPRLAEPHFSIGQVKAQRGENAGAEESFAQRCGSPAWSESKSIFGACGPVWNWRAGSSAGEICKRPNSFAATRSRGWAINPIRRGSSRLKRR